jgi:hypothetical protein
MICWLHFCGWKGRTSKFNAFAKNIARYRIQGIWVSFFGSTGVWTHGLHLSYTISLFCFSYFSSGSVLCFCLEPGLPSSYLCLPHSLVHTTMPYLLVEMEFCSLFAWAGLKLWSFWSLILKSWEDRQEPLCLGPESRFCDSCLGPLLIISVCCIDE